jgi:prepilin signal peptidase PulO-like enzyme (type II secretory pathway)
MNIILYIIVFILGLIIGSFLNCVIYRLEEEKSFLKGRSFCPHCKHILNWGDLIPVFSFIFLKTRCRYCREKISFQYPLVELATGLLFVSLLNYGFLSPFYILHSIFFILFSCFLIIIFIFDLKHYIIPDKVIFPAIITALIYNLYLLFISHYPLSTILNNFYAAFGAALFFLIIVLATKGKGMGVGDIKLAFFMGLLLGLPNILVALFLAFLIGAIIGLGMIALKKKTLKSEIPFGPFLILGTFIALFWGSNLINWYLNLFLF